MPKLLTWSPPGNMAQSGFLTQMTGHASSCCCKSVRPPEAAEACPRPSPALHAEPLVSTGSARPAWAGEGLAFCHQCAVSAPPAEMHARGTDTRPRKTRVCHTQQRARPLWPPQADCTPISCGDQSRGGGGRALAIGSWALPWPAGSSPSPDGRRPLGGQVSPAPRSQLHAQLSTSSSF